MRTARVRDDSRNTIYRVTNCVLGMPGEVIFGQRERRQFKRLTGRLDRLYCVNILSLTVWPTGYRIVCSAPAEAPDRQTIEAHFRARFGPHIALPDLDDPQVYTQWSARLRNISCMVKDLQQCFTQWYNRVAMKGRRAGTVWRGRFKSAIVAAARALLCGFAGVCGETGRRGEESARALARRNSQTFRERHPDLAHALEELRLAVAATPALLFPWMIPPLLRRTRWLLS